MNVHFPSGEELWLRRDYPSRGKPFVYREISYFSMLNFLTWGMIPFTIILHIVMPTISRVLFGFGMDRESLLAIVGFSILVCLPVVVGSFTLWLMTIKHSSKCPLWLYAEQLNPEQLKIYHFRKPPTIIKLASSTLDTKTKFKHYTTITITDKATETSATLGVLTPEEYDRFMQYWNVANPQDTAAS